MFLSPSAFQTYPALAVSGQGSGFRGKRQTRSPEPYPLSPDPQSPDTLNTNIHPTALPAEELIAQCDVRRLRRSGPGGQHRNKVETAVVLHHRPTGVKAEASERRSQAENRSMALFRLRVNLALRVRNARRPEDAPSRLWQSRSAGGRIGVSGAHDDFPVLLAEALDTVDAVDADAKRAAESLGCTVSQLVKLLKKEPRAMVLVNKWRSQRGLHALK